MRTTTTKLVGGGMLLSLLLYAIAVATPPWDDSVAGNTELISRATGGSAGNGDSRLSSVGYASVASVSDDGDVVAFLSHASDLVSGDTNGVGDLFLRIRSSESTVRVPAIDPNYPALSGNGNAIVFVAAPEVSGRRNDVYRYNRNTGVTKCATCALPEEVWEFYIAHFQFPTVSDGGRFVAFQLVFSGVLNVTLDPAVVLYDFQTEQYTLVSEFWNEPDSPAKGFRPVISGDGQHLAFFGIPEELMDANAPTFPAGEGAGCLQVMVYDRLSGAFEIASVDPNDHVAEECFARGGGLAISDTGEFVVFDSKSEDLAAPHGLSRGDQFEVYLRYRHPTTPRTVWISRRANGEQGLSHSYWPSVSGDGRFVSYHTADPNHVPGDADDYQDMIVLDLDYDEDCAYSFDLADETETHRFRASVTDGESEIEGGDCRNGWISGDGLHVVFETDADDVDPDDETTFWDIYIREQSGTVLGCEEFEIED